MNVNTAVAYKCPKCANELVLHVGDEHAKVYGCELGHSFDIAKEGYVNLQLVEKKKSKSPGDDREMMKSRRAFLNRGYYQTLAETLADTLTRLSANADLNLLDIGCGEGYYLDHLCKKHAALQCHGIDLSKHGVRLAAKRKLGAAFAVASAYDLPFFADSFDTVLSVFSPLCVEEFRRVLKPGGHLIMVGPDAGHLSQLASTIYKNKVPHQGNFDVLNGLSDNGCLVDDKLVAERIRVTQADLPSLLRMTPYYWKATQEQQAEIAKLPLMDIDLAFRIKVFKTA